MAGLCASQKQTCRDYRQGQLGETANFLDSVLSFLYLIMWPLLYIAGLAMDNTLVYGEWLGLTGLLYQFWSIMRTMANVCIVFVIIYTIGNSILNPDQMQKDLFKALGAIMIWGILINASWFLTGALVDISTIATYGVGTIPLKLNANADEAYCNEKGKGPKNVSNMDDVKKLGSCRPLLSTHGTMNLSDTFSADKSKRNAYYSYQEKNDPLKIKYFLTCPFKNGKLEQTAWDEFVDGYIRWVKTLADGKTETFSTDQKVADFLAPQGSIWRQYCVIWSSQLLDISSSLPLTQWSKAYEASLVWGLNKLHNRDGLRVRSLVDTHKGMIGVMYSMYGNILWYANIKSDVQTNETESQIIQFLVKWFFGFAMLFPLIALCIVLVMRVAILWVVIWFAPILVIVWVLQASGIKALDRLIKPFEEKYNFTTIVSLLFQPVLIVFVISMGTMFLDSLMVTMTADNGFGEALECNQFVDGKQCCKVVDFVDICFEKVNAQVGTDAFFNYFTYAILNIIGVMLLWFMVFAIIKSNKITQAVGETIQKVGRSYLGSLPVIPRFGGNMVWYDGLTSSLGKTREKVAAESEDTTGKTVVEPTINRFFDTATGKVGAARKEIAQVGESITPEQMKSSEGYLKYNDEVLKKIDEKKGDIQYSNANDLVDPSTVKFKTLASNYDRSDTMLDLLTNPKYISDSKSLSSADDAMQKFNVKFKEGKWYQVNKQKYFTQLAKNIEEKKIGVNLISWDKTNWLYAVQSWDWLTEKIYSYVKEMDDGIIKKINFAPKNELVLKTNSQYDFNQVKTLAGILSYEELQKFLESRSKTLQNEIWTIKQSTEDSKKADVTETPKPKPEKSTPPSNNDWAEDKNKKDDPGDPSK